VCRLGLSVTVGSSVVVCLSRVISHGSTDQLRHLGFGSARPSNASTLMGLLV
jgi:hypothetical protein